MPKSVKSSKSLKTYVPEAMYYNSIYPFVRGFLRKKPEALATERFLRDTKM